MSKRFRRFLLLVAVTSMIGGCAIPHMPLPTNPSNPLKRVALLPMKNDTDDVDGPNVVREKMAEALRKKSYIVMDLKESDQILRDRMGIGRMMAWCSRGRSSTSSSMHSPSPSATAQRAVEVSIPRKRDTHDSPGWCSASDSRPP